MAEYSNNPFSPQRVYYESSHRPYFESRNPRFRPHQPPPPQPSGGYFGDSHYPPPWLWEPPPPPTPPQRLYQDPSHRDGRRRQFRDGISWSPSGPPRIQLTGARKVRRRSRDAEKKAHVETIAFADSGAATKGKAASQEWATLPDPQPATTYMETFQPLSGDEEYAQAPVVAGEEEDDDDDDDDNEVDISIHRRRKRPFGDLHQGVVPERAPRRARSRSRSSEPDIVIGREGSREAGTYGTRDGRDDDETMYRPVSPTANEMDAYAEFEFTIPSNESSKDDLSDLESPAVDAETSQLTETTTPAASKATAVYSSHYTGNAELGGYHNATLTVLPDVKGQKRSLFRWLHIQQDVMNFDAFWVEVAHQIRLSESERNVVAKLRADVKRQCIKSRTNPKGAKVGYMDPRYIQIPLQSNGKQPKDASTARSARWICLPYFALQQYSGLLSASNPGAFPPQTLLQAEYSRSSQQRDMEQAVCQIETAPQGECFHIAQIWCLVLDNTLLVTCGAISEGDLRGEAVKVNPEPSRPLAGPLGPARFFVSYSDAVIWSFTTDECPTWFAFVSRFHGFWPQSVEFKRGEQVVNARNWSKMMKVALGSRTSITLTLKTTSPPEPPQRAVLMPERPRRESSLHVAGKPPQAPDYLHVLTLLNNGPRSAAGAAGTPGASGNQTLQALKVQLQSADDFLTEKVSYYRKAAYKQCKLATRAEVHAELASKAAQVEERESESIQWSYDNRVDVFNAVDIVYRLFLPSSFDGPTIQKFWGCISTIVEVHELDNVESKTSAQILLAQLRNMLRGMSQEVKAFQNIMSYADAKERTKIDLPRQFVTAWLHLVSGIMCFGDGEDDWYEHLARSRLLIGDGMQKIVQGVSSQDLLQREQILPMEVLSLITAGLLQDQVGKSDDIGETYSQYLSSLDIDIKTKPTDRSYQRKIELVQQEMSAVKRTISRQRYILACVLNKVSSVDGQEFERFAEDAAWRRKKAKEDGGAYDEPPPVYDAGNYNQRYELPTTKMKEEMMQYDDQAAVDLEAASKLSPTDASGFRRLFLTECVRFLEQRDFDFRRYMEYGKDLERVLTFKMSWTKDRQENAVYAFTIVTVVFLPLSSIASIFGMNTTDVRDMRFGQWLYWATAVPVTLFIIVLGLWWMNELGNAVGWLTGRRRAGAGVGYSGMMAPQEPLGSYFSAMSGLGPGPQQKVGAGYAPVEFAGVPEVRQDYYPERPAPVEGRSRYRRRPTWHY